MRRPFVAGNWKLHLGPQASAALAEKLVASIDPAVDATLAVFPTALSIPAVRQVVGASPVAVGIQDVEVAGSGAYTGSNSATIARELGCEFTLVGHSERRTGYADDIERTRQRLVASLDAGLLPILCVGESLTERQSGQAFTVIEAQLSGALKGLPEDRLSGVSVAYEPVWAIGTGETATPELAQETHRHIRTWLAGQFSAWVGRDMRLLYGGSVKASNAAALLSCPDIDGALVGGASLDPVAFAAIIAAALRARSS